MLMPPVDDKLWRDGPVNTAATSARISGTVWIRSQVPLRPKRWCRFHVDPPRAEPDRRVPPDNPAPVPVDDPLGHLPVIAERTFALPPELGSSGPIHSPSITENGKRASAGIPWVSGEDSRDSVHRWNQQPLRRSASKRICKLLNHCNVAPRLAAIFASV